MAGLPTASALTHPVALSADGIRGLYAGLTATLAAAVPSNAIYFGTYETCKAMVRAPVAGAPLLRRSPSPHHLAQGEARVDPSYFPLVHFAAGAASDLVSSLVYVPMEVVKCRLQLGRDPAAWTSGVVTAAQPYRGTAHALGTIFRREGLRGLYAGFGACIVTDCAYSAAQFLVYEQVRWQQCARGQRGTAQPCLAAAVHALTHMPPPLCPQLKALFRRRARRDGGEPRLTTPAVLAAGAGAGAVAAAITNPLDVITTRLMIQRQQGQQEADTSRRVRFPGYDSPVERRPLARAGPAQGPGLHTATPRVRALPRHGTPAGVASLLRVLDGALVRATRVPGQQGAYDPSSATPPRVTGLSRRLRAARSAAVPEAVAARRAAPGLPAPGSRAVVHYAGLWHGLRMIVRHSGWHGLWRGTVPRVVSIMPLSAIAFGVFENVRAYVYDSRTHRGVAAG